ncbi:hypothetical protein [Stakelama tenebrarum]|uniref:Uncharacterized protein n=1 Tax=Stakelama tenebrarum TaxID=2711215 RepID=A0A6G6Y2Z0_9SPHN|nr:hypothetical protein [Sphingosinithalassobacter tenebrarum]QIG79211.1 hypothetical protein G5C33_05000 [Sphingosinithalassobacter tenebrarum]
MASKTSKTDDWPGRRLDMAAYGRELARRRAEIEAEVGQPLDVPRNSGARRTESKRALLAEINRLAAARGFRW